MWSSGSWICFLYVTSFGPIIDCILCMLKTADYYRGQKEYIHLYGHDLGYVLVLLFRDCGADGRVNAACRVLSSVSIVSAIYMPCTVT